jgi:DNA-binding NarL/FixJ family response regulator
MNSLTSRERQIVLFLASGGLSNKDVGRQLNLSEGVTCQHHHKAGHQ